MKYIVDCNSYFRFCSTAFRPSQLYEEPTDGHAEVHVLLTSYLPRRVSGPTSSGPTSSGPTQHQPSPIRRSRSDAWFDDRIDDPNRTRLCRDRTAQCVPSCTSFLSPRHTTPRPRRPRSLGCLALSARWHDTRSAKALRCQTSIHGNHLASDVGGRRHAQECYGTACVGGLT